MSESNKSTVHLRGGDRLVVEILPASRPTTIWVELVESDNPSKALVELTEAQAVSLKIALSWAISGVRAARTEGDGHGK